MGEVKWFGDKVQKIIDTKALDGVEEVAAGYYFRFDRDQLANVALEARANFLQTMRNIGAFSPNDVRRELGYSVITAEDGGDDYGRPFNASGGTPAKDPAPEPAPAPTP